MEDRPAEAPPLARALSYFCQRRRWSPQRLTAAHGFADHRQIHGYLSGDRPLSREYLEHLLAPLEVSPEAIDTFLFSDGLIVLDPPPRAASPVALDREEQQAIDQIVMTAGWTLAEALRRELIREAKREKAEAARRQARELWADLKAADSQERRDLVEVFPAYRSWSLAELLCHESERMASHKIEVAWSWRSWPCSSRSGCRKRCGGARCSLAIATPTSRTLAGSPPTSTRPTKRSPAPWSSGGLGRKSSPILLPNGGCQPSKRHCAGRSTSSRWRWSCSPEPWPSAEKIHGLAR
jgi:hypothetical protein